jgi:hypothetical protein
MLDRMRPLPLALLAATALACSSPSSQPSSQTGSASGSVSGHSLGVVDGVGVSAPGAAIPAVYILLGNRSPLCTLLQGGTGWAPSGNQVASLTSLEFQLYDQRASAIAPGTFPVPMLDGGSQGQLEADVLFNMTGPGCESAFTSWATTGTVTLTSLQPTVTGTYDLTYGSDHLTGSFDVPYCSGVHAQGTGGDAGNVCQN